MIVPSFFYFPLFTGVRDSLHLKSEEVRWWDEKGSEIQNERSVEIEIYSIANVIWLIWLQTYRWKKKRKEKSEVLQCVRNISLRWSWFSTIPAWWILYVWKSLKLIIFVRRWKKKWWSVITYNFFSSYSYLYYKECRDVRKFQRIYSHQTPTFSSHISNKYYSIIFTHFISDGKERPLVSVVQILYVHCSELGWKSLDVSVV